MDITMRPQSSGSMSSPTTSSLFQVYLRLRPPQQVHQLRNAPERFLTVEPPAPAVSDATLATVEDQEDEASQITKEEDGPNYEIISEDSHPPLQQIPPTHITIHPPSESRKRAVEKFAFTRVFEEPSNQLDLFHGVNIAGLVEGVVGASSSMGRDALVATLGVTGSGKSHTILGSKSHRGILQLSLDVLYRSLAGSVLHPSQSPSLIPSLCATDASEAQLFSAQTFLDNVYGVESAAGSNWSRATTPMTSVGQFFPSDSSKARSPPKCGPQSQWSILSLEASAAHDRELSGSMLHESTARSSREASRSLPTSPSLWKNFHPSFVQNMSRVKDRLAKLRSPQRKQEPNFTPNAGPRRRFPARPTPMQQPQIPDVSNITVPMAGKMEYTVMVSMYEVYNDRIFDLLAPTISGNNNVRDQHAQNNGRPTRRYLLFKPTEGSPDRKVVTGLKKVVCGTYEEALMVLETGLTERKIAGTGSNSVSSRSHGFFVVEVKRRVRGGMSSAWTGASLTIVDLAGSERARNAKTAGATLAEAGKINESLMFLGQCLQMQSDQSQDGSKPNLVPYRQCKLTELLFSNSFPHHHPISHSSAAQPIHHRNPQKAIMIVTADPVGDFNATSQILRYSALAREVTVPRIPSVSSTILAGINIPAATTAIEGSQRTPSSASNRSTVYPSPRGATASAEEDTSMVDLAFSEIARLQEEVEILSVKLAEEERRRQEAEEGWQRADERAEDVEAEVRAECFAEMEAKMESERRRWVDAWGEEMEKGEQHLDRKLDILSRGAIEAVQVHEDAADREEWIQRLERENEELRAKADGLERELRCRSPTKPPRQTRGQSTRSTWTVAGATPQAQKDDTLRVQDNEWQGQSSISKVHDTDTTLGHETPDIFNTPATTGGSSLILDSPIPLALPSSPGPSSPYCPTSPLPVLGVSKMNSRANQATDAAGRRTVTPGKKMRKLTARKWDLMDETELSEYGIF